jgi:hypothetical protein
MFQRASDVCPGSEPLQLREPAPDVILPPHELGIELIEYVLGQSANGSHMRRLETVRREIVHEAQIRYESRACRRVQVTVIWGNVDCPTKNEQKKLAAAISQVVPSFEWNQRRVLRIHWEQFTASILQKYVAEISAYLVTDPRQELLVERSEHLGGRCDAEATAHVGLQREQGCTIPRLLPRGLASNRR